MGTRCLTYLYSQTDHTEPFFCLYRQFDGYREGHGAELAGFLRGKTIVNGIPFGVNKSTIANGMGCLAAQLVCHFKTEVGGFYIYPPKLSQDVWQDYEYHVWEHQVIVKTHNDRVIFTGTWHEFEIWCLADEEEED